jgi:hypothetical protein
MVSFGNKLIASALTLVLLGSGAFACDRANHRSRPPSRNFTPPVAVRPRPSDDAVAVRPPVQNNDDSDLDQLLGKRAHTSRSVRTGSGFKATHRTGFSR